MNESRFSERLDHITNFEQQLRRWKLITISSLVLLGIVICGGVIWAVVLNLSPVPDARFLEDEDEPGGPLAGDGQGLHYLSDLKEYGVIAGKGLGRGFITSGDPIRISVNGREVPHSLGLHPPGDNSAARVRYNLAKQFSTFQSEVAINDSAFPAGPGSPLTFEVHGDGKLLWASKPVQEARRVQECRITVTAVGILELRVHCPGDYSSTHAVWLQPRLVR